MTAQELLEDLAERGVLIEAEGDRLRYSPRSAVPPDLLEALRLHKAELLTFLQAAHLLDKWLRSQDWSLWAYHDGRYVGPDHEPGDDWEKLPDHTTWLQIVRADLRRRSRRR